MSFENNIKSWVQIDNQIKQFNEKNRELREERNELHKKILVQVQDTNLEHSTIEISDGTLKFATSKATKPLTLKFIHSCLENVISDSESVLKIMQYIKGQREVSTSKEIKRCYS
jgi:hypothetical protein